MPLATSLLLCWEQVNSAQQEIHCGVFGIDLKAHTHANQPHAGHLICGEGASLV